MKFLVKLTLFLFIIFLSAPTIVSVLEKNCDISFFIDSEESKDKIEEFKELKASLFINFSSDFFCNSRLFSSKIISENLSKHANFLEEIFSPPPELF